jgi:uncharacterized coiled-coil protein SlyX
VRARAEREEPAEPAAARADRKPKEPRPAPARTRPDPLAALEQEIEEQEGLVARLEARLAEDWTDVDTIAAHRRARDDLQRLFARWEDLLDGVAT